MDYDVIIAGGSFAGLAAAVQLRGKRVLMVEPHEIGAVQHLSLRYSAGSAGSNGDNGQPPAGA